jgi:3-(3-hydroxy-phenyl)propionate hydroxylase
VRVGPWRTTPLTPTLSPPAGRGRKAAVLSTYTWPQYPAAPAPEVGAAALRRVPVLVVGAGPVGLCLAIDLAQRGQPVLLIDEDQTVSIGSRAVCHAKRTLEIFDRLGVGQSVVDAGVTWNVGRTFHRGREVFAFDLLPDSGHRRPGMVNLQQYHLEERLVRRALELPGIELRFKHKAVQVEPQADGVRVEVETEQGRYTLHADWLIAADGAKSGIRRQLGLDFEGQVFQDRFLIADVLLDGEPFPADKTERRFWFEPGFHNGESALMHREADNVWRIDFQLGWDADAEAEKQPERVTPRIRKALDMQGFAHIGFELEWVSVYTFQCRRLARFRHGRVLFVGDSAHQVSPFGARGGNSGIQDADNLAWKLDRVLRGQASDGLIDSYDLERGAAADENIRESTRSTDFMTPKSKASRRLRQAVLELAAVHPFARALVNSGRLSVPTWLADSPLNTPDTEAFAGRMVPGAPVDDARLDDGRWLLDALPHGFVLLVFGAPAVRAPEGITALHLPAEGQAALRFDARPGSCVLLRPDQHVAARWRRFDPAAVAAAHRRALGF